MTTNDTIQALAIDALANARYIVKARPSPKDAAEYILIITIGMKRLALLERRQDLVDAISRMLIIHEAALAYATGRTYEVPR